MNTPSFQDQEMEPRLVLDPSGKQLFYHEYVPNLNFDPTIEWRPGNSDPRSIPRTGPYVTRHMTDEQVVTLAIQHEKKGLLPGREKNVDEFLEWYRAFNEEKIRVALELQNEILVVGDIIKYCRSELSLKALLGEEGQQDVIRIHPAIAS